MQFNVDFFLGNCAPFYFIGGYMHSSAWGEGLETMETICSRNILKAEHLLLL